MSQTQHHFSIMSFTAVAVDYLMLTSQNADTLHHITQSPDETHQMVIA